MGDVLLMDSFVQRMSEKDNRCTAIRRGVVQKNIPPL
jgi:hypothetical protein